MARRASLAAMIVVLAVGLGAQEVGSASIDNRAAAREFSYAAYQLRVGVKGLAPEFARHQAELEPCLRVAERAPRHAADGAMDAYRMAVGWAFLDAFRPHLDAFAAKLEGVPVSDPALRGGRAIWRDGAHAAQEIRRMPPDLCARFERWREAGYSRATKPEIPLVVCDPEDEEDRAQIRKLDAAARRMQALGVSRAGARRFSGETLYDGLPGLE